MLSRLLVDVLGNERTAEGLDEPVESRGGAVVQVKPICDRLFRLPVPH
jgi:hypothetical protein